MKHGWLLVVAMLGCAHSVDDAARSRDGAIERDDDTGSPADDSSSMGDDTAVVADDTGTTSPSDTGTVVTDTGSMPKDTGTTVIDTGTTVTDTGPSGPITGGPCVSGAPGATAIRVRFYNGGGKPTVSYDVWGLPDKSRQKVGVFGYTIPYTVPGWADPFLGEGGLQLDSSNFIDIELSTVGLSSISRATLSLYGRSYATSTSGSFTWQTFKGTGATPSSSMSNTTPYKWWPGTATAAFVGGDGGVLLRIKAGPSSNSVVVNKIELCMEAS